MDVLLHRVRARGWVVGNTFCSVIFKSCIPLALSCFILYSVFPLEGVGPALPVSVVLRESGETSVCVCNTPLCCGSLVQASDSDGYISSSFC